MEKMSRIIENVTLVEINDCGDQQYNWGDDGSLWLRGFNCASGVQVGDKGRLVLRRTPRFGLYYFEPYQA